MWYTVLLVTAVYLIADVSLDVTGVTVTLSSNPSTGVLGQGGVELRCSYQITTEFVSGIYLQGNVNGIFADIANFYPPNVPFNTTYTNDGQYLELRTTLINPGSGSSSAVLTFNRIECEDEKEYKCKILYAPGSHPMFSDIASLIVKGNPSAPDTVPLFAPTAGIEEEQTIAFTCTGNVGKPQGKFRWVRIRGNQKQIFDAETTTATVMPGTCTFNGTSTFTMTMTPEDKDVVVRCQIIYENIAKQNRQTQPIDVYYSVRGVQVSLPANAPPSYEEGADPIQLTCTAHGNPAPSSQDYTWYKESDINKPLGTGTTYTIQNVVVNETDNYVCLVKNSFNGKTFTDGDKAHIRIDISTTLGPTTTPGKTTYHQNSTTADILHGECQNYPSLIGAVIAVFIVLPIVEVIILYILYRKRFITINKERIYEDVKGRKETERHVYSTMNQSTGNADNTGEHYMDVS